MDNRIFCKRCLLSLCSYTWPSCVPCNSCGMGIFSQDLYKYQFLAWMWVVLNLLGKPLWAFKLNYVKLYYTCGFCMGVNHGLILRFGVFIDGLFYSSCHVTLLNRMQFVYKWRHWCFSLIPASKRRICKCNKLSAMLISVGCIRKVFLTFI
jgi:hypothetical protein